MAHPTEQEFDGAARCRSERPAWATAARTLAGSGRGAAIASIAICALATLPVGCSKLLPTQPAPGERFDQPLDGLSNGELGDFQLGQVQFRRAFTIREGLGPVFNSASCISCHSGDGRGSTENILVRFSRGTDLIPSEGGPQLQDKAIPGAEPERLPAGVDVSRRLPPPVAGIGLIEAISDSSILSHADPGDADADGISGRPNYVAAASYVPADEPGGGVGLKVGRFGRKAQVPALLQQVVEAYHQDMGITSSYHPIENTNPLATRVVPGLDQAADPEVEDNEVRVVTQYVRELAPPKPGDWTDRRRRGEAVFQTVRCAGCHVPTLHTGPHEIDALANRDVTLYSDLLLHDLGPDDADNRPDGDADGLEWRTTPLWGMRIQREFLDGRLLLLHDGRAHSVDEAVREHGGEAAAVRAAYLALSADDRAALLDFVESR